jgi:hypothetical protein
LLEFILLQRHLILFIRTILILYTISFFSEYIVSLCINVTNDLLISYMLNIFFGFIICSIFYLVILTHELDVDKLGDLKVRGFDLYKTIKHLVVYPFIAAIIYNLYLYYFDINIYGILVYGYKILSLLPLNIFTNYYLPVLILTVFFYQYIFISIIYMVYYIILMNIETHYLLLYFKYYSTA